jgi:hypothetical protein
MRELATTDRIERVLVALAEADAGLLDAIAPINA